MPLLDDDAASWIHSWLVVWLASNVMFLIFDTLNIKIAFAHYMNAAWMVEDAEWQTVAHTNLGVGVFDWAQLSLPLFSLMRIEMEKYDKFFLFLVLRSLSLSLSCHSYYYCCCLTLRRLISTKIFYLAHLVHTTFFHAAAARTNGRHHHKADKKCKSVHQSHNTCR